MFCRRTVWFEPAVWWWWGSELWSCNVVMKLDQICVLTLCHFRLKNSFPMSPVAVCVSCWATFGILGQLDQVSRPQHIDQKVKLWLVDLRQIRPASCGDLSPSDFDPVPIFTVGPLSASGVCSGWGVWDCRVSQFCSVVLRHLAHEPLIQTFCQCTSDFTFP